MLQYQLEYKEQGSPWIDATELKTNNTYMLISKNEKAYIYEVRVTARNKFGLGAASEVVTAAFAGILLTHISFMCSCFLREKIYNAIGPIAEKVHMQ